MLLHPYTLLLLFLFEQKSSVANITITEVSNHDLTKFTSGSLLNSKKVRLTIFYETMCPYSAEFIHSQLGPTYKKYHNYISLDFVPYGSTQEVYVNGSTNFTCHHGPKECTANIIHACAIYQQNYETDFKLLNFIDCIISSKDLAKATYRCAKNGGLNYWWIYICVNTGFGEELISKFGNRTRAFRPKLKQFPTIVFNDVFDSDDNEVAYNILERVICKNVPETCGQP